MRLSNFACTRNLILVVVFGLISTVAEARPSVASNTCSKLKSIIKSKGAAVINTKRGYTRFAHSQFYCDHFSTLEWKIVRARDGKCYLKTCVPYDRFK